MLIVPTIDIKLDKTYIIYTLIILYKTIDFFYSSLPVDPAAPAWLASIHL